MNLSEYDISNPFHAVLVASERLTPESTSVEVRHLLLELPDNDIEFVEGQSVGVLAPGPHEFGNKHHLRLYSVASPRRGETGRRAFLSLCVRRCFYIDSVSGESYPGKASNYLCDAKPGETIALTGPYGHHFKMPDDEKSNMLMIGVGTGIAPFRAFVRHIYEEHKGWKGKVRLFYGARSGMELLYMNDKNRDLGLYYTQETFKAFEAVSARPAFDSLPALDSLLLGNAPEVWDMVEDPKTYVYVAGLPDAEQKFEKAMIAMAGGKEAWLDKRASMIAAGRYAELIY